MTKSNLTIFFLIIILFILNSCITPPKIAQEEDSELYLVANINKGQELVRSGRVKEGELYFRIAESLSPNNSFIKNDLAFSLFSQQRWNEAIYFFLKALELNPGDETASLNLARAYYNSGHLEAAADLYHDIILRREKNKLIKPNSPSTELFSELEFSNSKEKKKNSNKVISLSDLYRRLAIVYYALGYFDDALCLSEKAFELALTMQETEQHVRMHLALDRTDEAFKILQATVSVHRNKVSSGILLDYALTLFLDNQPLLARQALLKFISKNGISNESKMQGRFIKFLIESKDESLSREDKLELFNDFLRNRKDICKNQELDVFDYWPSDLKSLSSKKLKEYCSYVR